MPYKDILVHLDNKPRSEIRMRIAVELAARHEAHLAGLYLMELPSLALFMGDASILDMRAADEIIRQGREEASTMAETVHGRFDEALRKNAIGGEWRCVDASAAQTLTLHARYADLVIIGQEDPEHFSAFGDSRIPETVILESGRPVLVIPYAGEVKPIGDTVLIGWKSTREAAHAIHDGMPLFAPAKSTTVLAIDPGDGIAGDGTLPADDIARHLARHDITVTVAHTVSGEIGAGDVLLNYASDLGADLIVVGGYGHSRAREFVLGGVTRSLLREMTVPVLFSH